MPRIILALLLQFGPPDSLRNPLAKWSDVCQRCTPLVGDCVVVRTECVPAPPTRCRTVKEIHCVAGISALEEFGKVQQTK